jgi:hypothetical protein
VKDFIAEGVKVRYISQIWSAEIIPTQEMLSKAKLALFVPLIVTPEMVTAVELELLRKIANGELAELSGMVPN